MTPNLEDMQVFLAVVESRSFTVAADRLARTKSAVSQAVTRLEKDLGAKLLYRSTRSLSLTEAGQEFYSHCRDIRESYDKALASIKDLGAKPSGLLTITAPHTLSENLIIPAITELLDNYPNINVRFVADDKSMDLIDAQIDIAVRVGTPDVQTAKISKLGTLHESLYVSADYARTEGGVPKELQALEHWQHIASDWQGQPIKYALAGDLILRVKPRVRCNTINDIIRLVLQGQGVARLPDRAVDEYVKQGQLIKLVPVASTPLYTMHMFANQPPIKVQRFVKILKHHLKRKGGWN